MAILNAINVFSSTATSSLSGGDATSPYTFQEWKIRNTNIAPGDLFAFYNTYLKTWYIRKSLVTTLSVDYIKKYYKTFLQTLGVTARTSEEQQLFENVNLESNVSIQAAIVGYARRLKDIAVYLANKRNDVLYNKLKNNLTGTSTSLERLFYSYILNAFTRKITPDGQITTSLTITNPNILTSLPYLNVISSNFSVEVEEIYDTNNYFDRDPSVPITNYTEIAAGTPEALYQSGSYTPFGTEEDLNSVILTIIESVAVANVEALAESQSLYFTFIGDDVTTTFALSGVTSSVASDYQVSVDGVTQTPDASYSISAQNQSITFTEAPPVTTIILVVARY